MVEVGEAAVHVPMVEAPALAEELRAAGIAARRLATAPADVKAIRAGRVTARPDGPASKQATSAMDCSGAHAAVPR